MIRLGKEEAHICRLRGYKTECTHLTVFIMVKSNETTEPAAVDNRNSRICQNNN